MLWSEQGSGDGRRYTVVPRTLIFVTHGRDVLLLRGAADKRIWPGMLNGLGGHVEPGEDVLSSAEREITEEAGIPVTDLRLRAVTHITGRRSAPGVMLFVFTALAASRAVTTSPEGEPVWCPLAHLPVEQMVHDLPALLERLYGEQGCGLVYGDYTALDSGEMTMRFRDG